MTNLVNRLKGWVTIGGGSASHDGKDEEHHGGAPVFIDESGKITRGPAGLTGRHIDDVDQGKRKPGEKPKPPKKPEGEKPPKKPKPEAEPPAADRPPEHEPEEPSTDFSQEEPPYAGTTAEPDEPARGEDTGGLSDGPQPGGAGEDVAPAPARSGDEDAGGGRQDPDQPAGEGAAGDVSGGRERVAASLDHVNRRLDRYERLFRNKGQEKQADWMRKLRDHVNRVGTDEALQQLGAEQAASDRGRVVYEGEKGGWESMDDFTHAYLNRHGIIPVHSTNEPANISSLSPKFTEGGGEDGYTTGDLFTPRDPSLKDKLEEAKNLPGLETSEDVSTIMGKPIDHLTPEVLDALDAKYGKNNWVVKPYTDDAFAGYGILFADRCRWLIANARDEVWKAGETLGKYGFDLTRDKQGRVDGIKHRDSGNEYKFGTDEYKDRIYGEAREAADRAAKVLAAENDTGVALFDRDGNLTTSSFMAQPAFPALGVNEADRAAGKTFEGGVYSKGEGRTHIVTRNGKAELVPHTTWLKGEWLPVVFENDDTKAMAQAALDAINALPESERQGQVYAPDIMRTGAGFKVVEANPSNVSGPSGYLGDNPFIIDSYVSHILGQEPGHTKFIRDLLSKKRGKQPKGLGRTVAVTKSGIINRLRLKSDGSCKPGQTAAQTGCTPAEGGGGPGNATAPDKGPIYKSLDGKTLSPESLRVGSEVLILNKPYRVIDLGPWASLKNKYPDAAREALANLPSHLDESKLGRAWAVQGVQGGQVWLLGSSAVRLFVKQFAGRSAPRNRLKGETVMDLDPRLTLRFPVNRLKSSFFETCDRDDAGRCKPGTGGGKKPSEKPAPGKKPVMTKPTHHPGAAHGSKVKLTPSDSRAIGDDLTPVATKVKLTKQETGRVAEAVCSAYLRDTVGFEDTVALNAGKANESIDLFGDSMAPEVKGGLCSNGRDAQKWRITFSMESESEKAAYAKMTEEQRTAYNRDKQGAALQRKLDLLKQLSKKLGREIKPVTLTCIVNPDTQTADVYQIPGYHPIMRWKDAAKYRVASVRYDHE